ncbi:MAG TPA: carbonic anhydrase, partial [Anaerolineae bacterium]
PGHIAAIVKAIQPAVDKTRGKPGNAIDNAVRANIESVMAQLKRELIWQEVKYPLKIVGAYYALESGVVTVIAQ